MLLTETAQKILRDYNVNSCRLKNTFIVNGATYKLASILNSCDNATKTEIISLLSLPIGGSSMIFKSQVKRIS